MASSVTMNVEVNDEHSIQRVAEDLHELAAQVYCNLKFTYQGIEMIVTAYHSPDHIVQEWQRRKKGLPETEKPKSFITKID